MAGIEHDILQVSRTAEPVRYVGILAKRPALTDIAKKQDGPPIFTEGSIAYEGCSATSMSSPAPMTMSMTRQGPRTWPSPTLIRPSSTPTITITSPRICTDLD